MKQTYIKPRIIVERFSLTQSIASGGCGVSSAYGSSIGVPTHADKFNCAWDVNGITFFIETLNACVSEKVPDDAVVDGHCYNNPEGAMIFASY